MDVIAAIREAVPLARIKGSATTPADDGAKVEVTELAQSAGFVIVVWDSHGVSRPATRDEVESAGFPYRGDVLTGADGETLGAFTPWH